MLNRNFFNFLKKFSSAAKCILSTYIITKRNQIYYLDISISAHYVSVKPPQWLCRRVTHLSRSVVVYWSSLEFIVFILTPVCINTPVTREQPPSDQITSSIKQTPLCGFGTQRSRPLAGGFSQCNSVTGSESEWLPTKHKNNKYREWSADRLGTVAFTEGL